MTAAMITEGDPLAGLDWPVACDVPGCQSGHPAATHRATLICGCVYLLCQSCTDYSMRALDRIWWSALATCKRCGAKFRNVRLAELYVSVLPLGAGR